MLWYKVGIIVAICCFGVHGASTLTNDEMKELCRGNEDKLIADPTDSKSFILCTQSNAYPKTCATDKCFDARSAMCKECLTTDDIVAYCQRSDDTMLELVPNKDCEYYSVCLGTGLDPVTEKCPGHQHFSEKKSKCTSPIEADCLPPSKWCQNKPNGVKFASSSCSKYYECFNRETILKSCLYYQYFDVQSNECLQGSCSTEDEIVRKPTCTASDEGVYMAHPKCNKFYVCVNKVAFEGQCPTGYYFNVSHNNCLKDYTNECTD